MEIIKKKFHTLEIKAQIQYGILTVTTCICLLLFSMLSIYSFVIINLSYIDLLQIIDDTESKGLETYSQYLDSKLSINSEMILSNHNLLNNFITNLDSFKDLQNYPLDLINKKLISEVSNVLCTNNCLYYKTTNNSDISKILQVIYHSLPFFEFVSKFNILDLNDLITKQNSISILSYNAEFHFSSNSFKEEKNITELNKNDSLNNTTVLTYKDDELKTEINNNSPSSSVFSSIITWKNNFISNSEKNSFFDYTRIKFITTKSGALNSTLFSNHNCNYFLRLNNLNNLSTTLPELHSNSTILDCFTLSSAIYALNYLHDIPEWLTQNYIRKLKYPIISLGNSKEISTGINYKIFKYNFPSKFSSQIATNFRHVDNLNIYFFKETKDTETQYRFVFYKFLAIMFSIILCNFSVWLVVMLTIIYLVRKASVSITKPIQELIKYVTNIGLLSENNYESTKELDDIVYNDDKDINEMFIICKELIKGGFKPKSNLKNKDSITLNKNDFYLNECATRKSNLIIDEVFIEKDYNRHVKNIFNFIPRSIINKGVQEANIEFKEVNYEEDCGNEDRIYKSPRNSEVFKQNKNRSTNCLSEEIITLKSCVENYSNLRDAKTPDSKDNELKEVAKIMQINEVALEYSKKNFENQNYLYNTFKSLEFNFINPYPSNYFNININYK